MPNRVAHPDRDDELTNKRAVRAFAPRLLPTIAVLLAVALFVTAGNWQRARMQSKESLRAQHDAVAHLSPRDLPDVRDDGNWTAQRFLPVLVRGRYAAVDQILIDNRIRSGRAGYEVVTP